MKADKENCFVVMDRTDYDTKMEAQFGDCDIDHLVENSPIL